MAWISFVATHELGGPERDSDNTFKYSIDLPFCSFKFCVNTDLTTDACTAKSRFSNLVHGRIINELYIQLSIAQVNLICHRFMEKLSTHGTFNQLPR